MLNELIFQLPRENIWQKSQMITFDDIMQQSGLDEFSDLVEAEHNASLQAQGNLLKPTMILPPGQAEPTPQEPKTKDQMIDELKRIQQDFAFSKIDDFLGRYNVNINILLIKNLYFQEKEEQQQIEKQPQNEQQQTNAQMQPITADQISGMLNIQPVAGSSDMMLSLQECSQEYGEDRVRIILSFEVLDRKIFVSFSNSDVTQNIPKLRFQSQSLDECTAKNQ